MSIRVDFNSAPQSAHSQKYMSAELALALARERTQRGFPLHLCQYDNQRMIYNNCCEVTICKTWETPGEFTFESLFPSDWKESFFADHVIAESAQEDKHELVADYRQLREECRKMSMEEIIESIGRFRSFETSWKFFRGEGALEMLEFFANWRPAAPTLN